MTTPTDPTNPRKKASVAVATIMLLVGGLFLAAGVAATGSSLAPLASRNEAAGERGLSRSTATLAVYVAVQGEDERPDPVAGAVVTLLAPHQDSPLAADTTDDHGRVVFELRRGAYHGIVEYDGMIFEGDFVLRMDTRAIVVFGPDGEANVFTQDRRDVERDQHSQGRTPTLAVFVRQGDDTDRRGEPIAGAALIVYRIEADGDRAVSAEPVARGQTDPQGRALFNLRGGHYAVSVETPAGDTARGRVDLRHNAAIGFLFDDNGNATVHHKEGGPHDGPRDRPSDRQTDRPSDRQASDRIHLGIQATTQNERPVPGAHVQIYRITGEDDRGELVNRGATGERGVAIFTLEPGQYRVVVTKGDISGQETVDLSKDQRLRLVLA